MKHLTAQELGEKIDAAAMAVAETPSKMAAAMGQVALDYANALAKSYGACHDEPALSDNQRAKLDRAFKEARDPSDD